MKTPSEHRPLGLLWMSIQSFLFPMLENEIGELDAPDGLPKNGSS